MENQKTKVNKKVHTEVRKSKEKEIYKVEKNVALGV